MTALLAIVRKDLKLFLSDRRALIMSFAAPIALASFFGFVFSSQGMDDERGRIAIHVIEVVSRDFDRAFSAAAKERAMVVVSSPVMFPDRKRIADLAIKHRLPTVVGGREYTEAGGLFSYAVHYPELFRRAAVYVDKILKGARPAELPIEQPTRFELVINLKTARALGVAIPKVMLLRADETIE